MRRLGIGLAALLSVSMADIASAQCAGDCGGDRMVTVSELITGVNIALGGAVASQCPSIDGNGDGSVVVNELVSAVANALNGCPFLGQYGTRIDVGDGETALIRLQVATDGTAIGTLSVGPTAPARGAALRIDIPFLNLTGTVDLDSGAYHLTGTVPSSEGDVPVDVSGVLPERPGLEGTLQLEVGPETFSGPIRTGNGDPAPTPTATRPAASPTPTFTPTAMPANYPTPGETCQDASFSLVFHDPVGVNSYVDLGPGLSIGKGTLTLVPGAAFGGGAVPCTVNLGDVIRRVQLIYVGAVSAGASIPLGRARGQATFDYLEMPVSNPLGTRGWRSDSGTLVIDHLDATSARFHIANAVMSPEPSFSFQQPATGTFTIDAGAGGKLTQP